MHLNSCYNSEGEFNPLLVYMSDPCTQGLHQLRAVKDEPLEFCLYTQTSPHPHCDHNFFVNTNIRLMHTHATSHHTLPAAHSPKIIMATSHLLIELNHCCYAHAIV